MHSSPACWLGAAWRACRPHNAVLAMSGAMLGVWLAAHTARHTRPDATLTQLLRVNPWPEGPGIRTLVALAVVVSCAVAAANVWNDVCDVAADRVNAPQRPIAAGLLSRRAALVLTVLFTVVALLAAGLFSSLVATLMRVGVIAALIYSPWIKSTVLMGNVWVATLSASTVLLGALATFGYSARVGVAFTLLMLVVLLREMMKSAADVVGDAASGLRSVATSFGPARAIHFSQGVCVVFAALGLAAPVLVDHATRPMGMYVAWWCTAVILPLVLAFASARAAVGAPSGLRRALRLSKLAGAGTVIALALLP